ncbi:unnamed protein product [Phyllotreta striolata]|uniref:Cytochrome P450 n=1 Tax=Phyllotreta striolata TaxID=444603 RepID=A0A9N9XJR6_PHYSR|nr:unnamed protein product [Phyllotreta striolata]
MSFVVAILVGVIATLAAYLWLKIQRGNNKLKWIPEAPGLPLIGNVLELQKSTEILNKLLNHCQQNNGLCTIRILTEKYIVVSDPEFLEFLLGKLDILDKTDEYQYLDNWLLSGLLTAKADIWKTSRKMLTPTFHFSVLENFIETFNLNTNILVELLSKEVDKDYFNIAPFITMASLDIICETTMGVSIDAQKNPKSDYTVAVKGKCKLLVDRTYSAYKRFEILYPLSKDYYLDKKYNKTLQTFTIKVINDRKNELKNATKKNENKTNDEDMGIKKRKVFLDLLLEATINGRPLSEEEIRREVNTFMFAGHDTTSSSINFTLYCLSLHPEVQKRAVEEQERIFGDEQHRPAAYRDLQEMKYLEMVIKESMRMYPPVPYIGRKTSKDIPYKNEVIPANTSILVMIFCANRNPKFYPQPDKFDPSRFEESKVQSQYSYLPFSAGPRNCIGQKYAMMEMKVVLSVLLRNFEFLPSGMDLTLAAEAVLDSLNGVNLKIKRREKWNEN